MIWLQELCIIFIPWFKITNSNNHFKFIILDQYLKLPVQNIELATGNIKSVKKNNKKLMEYLIITI